MLFERNYDTASDAIRKQFRILFGHSFGHGFRHHFGYYSDVNLDAYSDAIRKQSWMLFGRSFRSGFGYYSDSIIIMHWWSYDLLLMMPAIARAWIRASFWYEFGCPSDIVQISNRWLAESGIWAVFWRMPPLRWTGNGSLQQRGVCFRVTAWCEWQLTWVYTAK